MKLNVNSEIGRLEKVLVHRPGSELENLTPQWLERLLFDDIPWLDLAQKEHDGFVNTLRKSGVEVLYLTDLVADVLHENKFLKERFIDQFTKEGSVMSETLRMNLSEYLNNMDDTKEMVSKTMAGIRKDELPSWSKRTLTDFIDDYPFVTDPMPNLYFTRDPFTTIGNGISMNHMYTVTRNRETIYSDMIFKHHNLFKEEHVNRYYDRNYILPIEGGDILVLNKNTLAIGVSQRTHPSAIEKLARNIFFNYNTSFTEILAFDIPKSRAFMHLDTVFTQIDYGKFTIHNSLNQPFKVYKLSKNKKNQGTISIDPLYDNLDKILAKTLNTDITLIPCGGGDPIISGREQWNDGANTLAIAPGEVVVYSRNHVTNDILDKNGIKIHSIDSSELSRGRGGPRCMTMPLVREEL